MPRYSANRPAPKSRKKLPASTSKNVNEFLGDGSAAGDSSAEEASFRSADLGGQTDYGLDFTHSISANLRSSQTRRDSTSIQRNKPQPVSPKRVTTKKPGTKNRKQTNPQRIQDRFWKEVKKLQSNTGNMIPKASFGRVVREILMQSSSTAERVTLTALFALQEASEMYLTNLFQDAYCCTLHRGRITLDVRDIELTRYLRGRNDPGNG